MLWFLRVLFSWISKILPAKLSGFTRKEIDIISESFILKADGYKASHPKFYAAIFKDLGLTITKTYNHFQIRHSSQYDHIVFFGLQYYIDILKKVKITHEEIDVVSKYMKKYFGNKEIETFAESEKMWRRIVNVHNGRVPVRIQAVPEGTLVPKGNVVMTVESTDAEIPCIVGFMETFLMPLWFPCLVATKSKYYRDIIMKVFKEPGVVVDFAYRSDQCEESAQIGGAAHGLVYGDSDTHAGNTFLMKYYNNLPENDENFKYVIVFISALITMLVIRSDPRDPEDSFEDLNGKDILIGCLLIGYIYWVIWHVSNFVIRAVLDFVIGEKEETEIPCHTVAATEHSIATCRGPEGERKIIDNILDLDIEGPISMVIDSYNDYGFINYLLEQKDRINQRKHGIIIRPDSRNPSEIIPKIMTMLVGAGVETTLENGLKVLHPNWRIIFGDSLNDEKITQVCETLSEGGWSIKNVSFGVGGNLRYGKRDHVGFACKLSNISLSDGTSHDVFKAPQGCPGKVSLKGKFRVVGIDGVIRTVAHNEFLHLRNLLQLVYQNGTVYRHHTWQEIRHRVRSSKVLIQKCNEND